MQQEGIITEQSLSNGHKIAAKNYSMQTANETFATVYMDVAKVIDSSLAWYKYSITDKYYNINNMLSLSELFDMYCEDVCKPDKNCSFNHDELTNIGNFFISSFKQSNKKSCKQLLYV
ncbi:MAG TPA: hypothetical protein DD761_02880 [Cyanobacteria bacterium UBA11691]|nr:hypothetical protein [Cyanobacteria bacterium UBA11691]